MIKSIIDPPIPYIGLIPTAINPGKLIRIQGTVPAVAYRDSRLQAIMKAVRPQIGNFTIFRGVSSTIQNELISSVGEVMIQEIKAELSKAPFVALIMDETSHISVKFQLFTVMRYVSAIGSVEERFLHFTDVSSDQTANGLLQHALKILHELGCNGKLVDDGAAVMA
ncbi:hypothetical protein ILUMI_09050 [Ignelater luminosus]|uniref:DUF4371 domain-containing protein n=1 Tax=Ignelater luminosus TaxID=2038154 RepID=A0A8K0D0R0_IGNLU|nr:hypothetical protein ILUMI_09050 [Ignelater luminosus]